MIDKLPYTLTKGVTATQEGLLVTSYHGQIVTQLTTEEWEDEYEGNTGWGLIPWRDAAERLRYREGEPWSHAAADNTGIIVGCYKPLYSGDGYLLHRLAAILCDGSEEFRVLHWCVHNLGQAGGGRCLHVKSIPTPRTMKASSTANPGSRRTGSEAYGSDLRDGKKEDHRWRGNGR